ncbi:leucyl aminopeptidase family protein [Oharaeibacter diazotrophicus]|uniref:Leucyl aminopeptidase n=1 Tax=Oharaeibacter diazotrophicus TaxID=1920512 RepID=A0A4R6R9R6_9HYPH|nr:leucyl aminopeptidase [Oharaeibacter diazotrophicus]BBE72871.1 putative cytosol aminopeptidase [Pleomorphomonas sp. SM30]GLS76909.1 leucyl aminopeptidase [Oharaeibacter diazotrophicus]
MLACFLPPDTTEAAVPVHAIAAADLAGTLDALGPAARAWAGVAGFEAKAGTHLLLPDEDGRLAGVLFGLGKPDGARTDMLLGKLAGVLPPGAYRLATFEGDLDLALTAFALGAYRFERYVAPKETWPRLVLPSEADVLAILRTAAAVHGVRDLVNTPANDLGTAELAAAVHALAAAHGAEIEEIVGDHLLAANYPLVHAVGAASARPPRLVTFTWGDPAAPKVTLVGKGVVFDTGGLNIKPDASMLLMKKDMGGAANVLGLARMVMEAGLSVRLRVVVPIVENSISGNAFRPGDVYRSRKGLTVEIGNTDAEGRLILADALAFADEEAPEVLVDMATLTGAARVALGPDLPPVYTRDDDFAAELAAASAAVADPCWRLPLWPPYDDMLKSKIADVNHISGGSYAGSITAALFLGRFVEKARTWLHADIFAWTPSAKPASPEGGEAQVIRALYAVLAARYGRR